MAECEAVGVRLVRNDALPAEHELVRHVAGDEAKQGRRDAQPSPAMHGARELLHEDRVAHLRRRGGVHGTRISRLRDDVGDEPHHVVARDPRDPLLTAPDHRAQPPPEQRQRLAEGAAIRREHDAEAQPYDAGAECVSLVRGPLPRLAQAMGEAALAAVELGERLVAPQSVPADGGRADEHCGPMLEPRDQPHDRARHPQPGREDQSALVERPRPSGDRLAGEIDDGVDGGILRHLAEIGDQAAAQGLRCPRRIAHQRRHLVAGIHERLHEAAADEAGGAGDQDVLATGQRLHQLARRRRVPHSHAPCSHVPCGHGATSRKIAIWRMIRPKRGWKICSVKLNLPSGSSAWVT